MPVRWRTRRAKRVWLMGLAALMVLPLAAFVLLWVTLPTVGDLHQRAQTATTKILDRHGRLLFEVIDSRSESSGRHTPVSLARMPRHLLDATIAVEDANFYSHPGVDVSGIARALWINVQGGEALAGGSTITQQLARMLLLDAEERGQRTLLRKLRESLLAWQINQQYSKDDVLALYLNEAYYGNLAYGVEAAARAYFGKSANEMDLAECAFLAGLPQSPAVYDPFNDPEPARTRQHIVLDLMVKQGYLSEADALTAKAAPLSFAPERFDIRAPHFVAYVRQWLEREFGVDAVMRGGLTVTTTLDLGLNDAAESVMRQNLAKLANPNDFAVSHNANNAALVAIDPRTGEIVAMVGSPDYFDAEISGAVNASVALRQPGSAIKPITYATAFGKLPNFNAATPIFDVRTAFPTREGLPYLPVNYDRQNHGPISARDALATSNNVAAVSVLQRVGLRAVLDQASALGMHSFRSADDYGLSLTLGGGEVRLLELAAAYGAFASNGQRVDPYAISSVTGSRGEVLFRREAQQGTRPVVLDPRVAWLMSDILNDNAARAPAFGEINVLRLTRKAAVKTGTTQDFRDNWTVGYTPQLVTGVWVGNANGAPMERISGVSGAGPIWHDFMEIAHRNLPQRWFDRPNGLVRVAVCDLSGLLPTPDCSHTHEEWFIDGTQPRMPDTWHRRIRVDASTGRPATPNTPTERIVERVMLDLPAPLRDWARVRGWPVLYVPDSADTRIGTLTPGVSLVQPDAGAVFHAAKELPLSVQRMPIEVQLNGLDAVRVEVLTQSGQRVADYERTPYRSFWPLEPGEHVLFARVHLADGTTRDSAPVRVTVRA